MKEEEKFIEMDQWDNQYERLIFEAADISRLVFLCQSIDRFSIELGDKIKVYREIVADPFKQLVHLRDQCSTLSDSILFFVRKEIRLHCYYFLNQIEGKICVEALNRNLASIVNRCGHCRKELSYFLFHDLNRLIPAIIIKVLPTSKMSTNNLLSNVISLKQSITVLFYRLYEKETNWLEKFTLCETLLKLMQMMDRTHLKRFLSQHEDLADLMTLTLI